MLKKIFFIFLIYLCISIILGALPLPKPWIWTIFFPALALFRSGLYWAALYIPVYLLYLYQGMKKRRSPLYWFWLFYSLIIFFTFVLFFQIHYKNMKGIGNSIQLYLGYQGSQLIVLLFIICELALGLYLSYIFFKKPIQAWIMETQKNKFFSLLFGFSKNPDSHKSPTKNTKPAKTTEFSSLFSDASSTHTQNFQEYPTKQPEILDIADPHFSNNHLTPLSEDDQSLNKESEPVSFTFQDNSRPDSPPSSSIKEEAPLETKGNDFHQNPVDDFEKNAHYFDETNLSSLEKEYLEKAKNNIVDTLKEFHIHCQIKAVLIGPSIFCIQILPEKGIKLSKILALEDNLALSLAVNPIRLLIPIPGQQAIGIEIPRLEKQVVYFLGLIQTKEFLNSKAKLPILLGQDIQGKRHVVDLAKMPHLLIAGSTGSGKSVCVNSLICSLMDKCSPKQVQFLMIDPKIVELNFYNKTPYMLTPSITQPKKALQALSWCIKEMESRYQLLEKAQVRDLPAYNEKFKDKNWTGKPLPYIVVIVDEFADIMATSGKELETRISRLAAMSRAVGIHLVLATQRPSVDVITGVIKANFPSRIAFMVPSKFDSRTILDTIGAEQLLGSGDMLFLSSQSPITQRLQGSFLTDQDVLSIVEKAKQWGEPHYLDDEIFDMEEDQEDSNEWQEDPLFSQALDIVRQSQKASVSFLQRRLKIGYNRSARLIEQMEKLGYIGPAIGSKPRDIYS